MSPSPPKLGTQSSRYYYNSYVNKFGYSKSLPFSCNTELIISQLSSTVNKIGKTKDEKNKPIIIHKIYEHQDICKINLNLYARKFNITNSVIKLIQPIAPITEKYEIKLIFILSMRILVC